MRARGQAAGIGIGAHGSVGDHIAARVIGIGLGGICGAHAVGKEQAANEETKPPTLGSNV